MKNFDREVALTLLESTKGQNPQGNVTVRVADLAHVAQAALDFAPPPPPPKPADESDSSEDTDEWNPEDGP